jgi:hypothetical protein
MQATLKGNLSLRHGDKILQLKDVLVVPEFVKYIISVGRLSNGGNKIAFQDGDLVIEEPGGNAIVIQQMSQRIVTTLMHQWYSNRTKHMLARQHHLTKKARTK